MQLLVEIVSHHHVPAEPSETESAEKTFLETANFHLKAGLKGCPAQLWQVQLWWRSQWRSFPRHSQRWRSTNHQSWTFANNTTYPYLHDPVSYSLFTINGDGPPWGHSWTGNGWRWILLGHAVVEEQFHHFRQVAFAQCGRPSILWRLPGWLLRVQLPQSCKKTEPPHSLECHREMIHCDPRISCAAAMAHLESVLHGATEQVVIPTHSIPSTSKAPFLHVAINAQGHKD